MESMFKASMQTNKGLHNKSMFRKSLCETVSDTEKSSSINLTEVRDMAHKYCSQYIRGPWIQATTEDIVIQHITGGLSNLLFLCSLRNTLSEEKDKPSVILLRFFGSGETVRSGFMTPEEADHRQMENIICTMFSERSMGPQLYGIFRGGRLEQYVEAESLKPSQFLDVDVNLGVARILAQIHDLRLPMIKDTNWLFTTMHSYLNSGRKINVENDVDIRERSIASRILKFNFEAEIEWLRRYLESSCNSPIVFCHNDLQGGNILLYKNDKRILVIDYEYSGYNYRAYDIANHFIERMFDYQHRTFPYYKIDESLFPSQGQQRNFIKCYIDAYYKRSGTWVPNDKDQVMQILKEVESVMLVPYLFWVLWSFWANERRNEIAFGYFSFAQDRLEQYWKHKSLIVQTENAAQN